jgi:hypothetical protein
MFTLMPYENSLVVMEMNGPQLKAVLERAYRNYYYYKYVSGYGGYSYYTTCMLDTNAIGKILYQDTAPALPNGNNVVALVINGKPVDFNDTATFYKVSTVNYLAAGSCNFNDGGVSLWPLNQIVNDTQYYVRDAVIDYITAMGTVSPKIEGRLAFGDSVPPVITVNAPMVQAYGHSSILSLDFSIADNTIVKEMAATLDGTPVNSGQKIDLYTLAYGPHTLMITASDYYGNNNSQSVTFTVVATVQSLQASIVRFYSEGKITNAGTYNALIKILKSANDTYKKGNVNATISKLQDFIMTVKSVSGKQISTDAANLLIADAEYVISTLK